MSDAERIAALEAEVVALKASVVNLAVWANFLAHSEGFTNLPFPNCGLPVQLPALRTGAEP